MSNHFRTFNEKPVLALPPTVVHPFRRASTVPVTRLQEVLTPRTGQVARTIRRRVARTKSWMRSIASALKLSRSLFLRQCVTSLTWLVTFALIQTLNLDLETTQQHDCQAVPPSEQVASNSSTKLTVWKQRPQEGVESNCRNQGIGRRSVLRSNWLARKQKQLEMRNHELKSTLKELRTEVRYLKKLMRDMESRASQS